MPELPEVETVKRGLSSTMEGAKILRVEQNRADLRFPFDEHFRETLEGAVISELGRRSKYLLFHLSNNQTLIAHLGMSGSFRIAHRVDADPPGDFLHKRNKNEKHDHVIMHLEKDGTTTRIIYNDPRRFGFMLLVARNALEEHPFFKDLGPEPTGNGVSTEYLIKKFQNRRSPLKSVLLDQKVIAGLGNIYVCEALWRSRLSPLRKAESLVGENSQASPNLQMLTRHIHEVISDAIKAGGSSLQDHIQADGSLGYFQHSFAVYGREGDNCRHRDCDGIIGRITQSGRSTFYCPSCQK